MRGNAKGFRPRSRLPRIAAACGLWTALSCVAQEGPEPAPPSASPKTQQEANPHQPSTADQGGATTNAGESWKREIQELERLAQEGQGPDVRGQGPSGWTLGFWMALVIALAGGAIWATLRFRRQLAGKSGTDGLQIISRQAIDPKNSVVVLRARGHDYLLGVGPAGVSLLTMLPAARPEAEQNAPKDQTQLIETAKTQS